jgi:hypothetical protein
MSLGKRFLGEVRYSLIRSLLIDNREHCASQAVVASLRELQSGRALEYARVLLGTLAVLLIGSMPSHAYAATATPDSDFSHYGGDPNAKPPGRIYSSSVAQSPTEFITKIVPVLSEKDVWKIPERFEKSFGVVLRRHSRRQDKGKSFSEPKATDWNLPINMQIGSDGVWIKIGDDVPLVFRTGHRFECVTWSELGKWLERYGWVGGQVKGPALMIAYFKGDKSVSAIIRFAEPSVRDFGDCVDGILLMAMHP